MTDFATPSTAASDFAAKHPKPVHFHAGDYEAHKAVIDGAAAAAGYRLAGFHRKTKEAVFTSKVP